MLEQSPTQPTFQAGAIKINYISYFYLFLTLVTPLYTYHVAVKKHEQPPFPHATVTNTACHYPQSIIFRWTMTSAGCFLTLIYSTIFRWFEKQAKRIKYPGTTLSELYWPGQLSILGYLAAICTIDNGGTGTLHAVGAVYFFIILFAIVVGLTVVAYHMRQWDVTFIKRKSLFVKILLAGYLAGVWIYSLIGLIFEFAANEDDIYIVIVEWNCVFVSLVWVLSFAMDWRHIYIGLNGQRQQKIEN